MATTHVLNVDLAKVYATKDRERFRRTLAWGDEVEVVDMTDDHVEVRVPRFVTQADGSVKLQSNCDRSRRWTASG